MTEKHEALIHQFPKYAEVIRALARSNVDFDNTATGYEKLRREIHALEATGDVGPDYSDLCQRRDALQEKLVITIQTAAG